MYLCFKSILSNEYTDVSLRCNSMVISCLKLHSDYKLHQNLICHNVLVFREVPRKSMMWLSTFLPLNQGSFSGYFSHAHCGIWRKQPQYLSEYDVCCWSHEFLIRVRLLAIPNILTPEPWSSWKLNGIKFWLREPETRLPEFCLDHRGE